MNFVTKLAPFPKLHSTQTRSQQYTHLLEPKLGAKIESRTPSSTNVEGHSECQLPVQASTWDSTKTHLLPNSTSPSRANFVDPNSSTTAHEVHRHRILHPHLVYAPLKSTVTASLNQTLKVHPQTTSRTKRLCFGEPKLGPHATKSSESTLPTQRIPWRMQRSVPGVEMRTIQSARGKGMEQHFLALERQRRRLGEASLACLATAAAAGKTKANPWAAGSGQAVE